MNIRLNGNDHWLESPSTVAGLLETLKLDMRKVAVELNLAIVPRSLYGEKALNEGDEVEIVRFIGGG